MVKAKRKKDKVKDQKISTPTCFPTASSPIQSTSRSILGLLHQKVFDPTQPPKFVLGYFPFKYLPIVSRLLIKMSIESAKVLKTEPLV